MPKVAGPERGVSQCWQVTNPLPNGIREATTAINPQIIHAKCCTYDIDQSIDPTYLMEMDFFLGAPVNQRFGICNPFKNIETLLFDFEGQIDIFYYGFYLA